MSAGLVAMLALAVSGEVAWTWYVLAGTAVTVTVGLGLEVVLRPRA